MIFKSHNLTEDRLLKIVIRDLLLNTKPELIVKLEFEKLNYKIKPVIQMMAGRKASQKLTSHFYVQMQKTIHINKFYCVAKLLGVTIKTKKYCGEKGPSLVSTVKCGLNSNHNVTSHPSTIQR